MEHTYDPEAAATLLTDLAQRHGYSLRHVARLSGVHDRTVTNYANGHRQGTPLRNPDPELWLRIAVVFGPDDGAKLMEVCGLPIFAEALRRFDLDDAGEVIGLEFLPHFQRPRIARIIRDVIEGMPGYMGGNGYPRLMSQTIEENPADVTHRRRRSLRVAA